MRLLPVLTLTALLAALPAAAHAETTCTMDLKSSYRLAAVKKRGLRVKVTCDGPARVIVPFDFKAGTRPAREWILAHKGPAPQISHSKPTELEEAGTVTVRTNLAKDAARFARRFRKVPLLVFVAVAREDRPDIFDTSEWGQTALRR